jgi:hypothetical protein
VVAFMVMLMPLDDLCVSNRQCYGSVSLNDFTPLTDQLQPAKACQICNLKSRDQTAKGCNTGGFVCLNSDEINGRISRGRKTHTMSPTKEPTMLPTIPQPSANATHSFHPIAQRWMKWGEQYIWPTEAPTAFVAAVPTIMPTAAPTRKGHVDCGKKWCSPIDSDCASSASALASSSVSGRIPKDFFWGFNAQKDCDGYVRNLVNVRSMYLAVLFAGLISGYCRVRVVQISAAAHRTALPGNSQVAPQPTSRTFVQPIQPGRRAPAPAPQHNGNHADDEHQKHLDVLEKRRRLRHRDLAKALGSKDIDRAIALWEMQDAKNGHNPPRCFWAHIPEAAGGPKPCDTRGCGACANASASGPAAPEKSEASETRPAELPVGADRGKPGGATPAHGPKGPPRNAMQMQ